MSTVATLDTVLRLNSTAFRQGMVQAAAQANQSLGSIQRQATETAKVLLSLKRAADAFGSFYLVKEGIASLIEAQTQLQAIQFTLKAATGSSTAAADAFAFVRKESDQLGLVLPTAAQGFANLSASATAAGVSMKDQQQLFDAFAKSASSLHLSTDQSNRALLALEQMFSKGKIQAQELRLQLGQAIPGAAARFQNAVLQMTKGTKLASLSFEQLLEQGKLTTSQFLPALVTALQSSARGWEEASDGLNANINRVKTAFFNLKTQLSGGIFSDAVSLGARALADNLGRVATAAELAAGGALARVLGGNLRKAATAAVSFNQQNISGPRMAAQAEAAYTAALVERTAEQANAAQASALANVVYRDAAAAAALNAKQVQFEALAQQEAAAAEVRRIESVIALNNALATSNTITVQRAKLNDQLLAAQTALVASTDRLAVAQAEYDAAVATGNRLKAEQAVLSQRNAAAQAAEVAAVEANVVAQRELAAATSLTVTAGKAFKSLGSFALGLVGGPWGAAVAAIAAIGYAFYASKKAAEEYRAQTQGQVESLKQLQEQAQATADAIGKAGAQQNTTQVITQVVTGGAEITKTQMQLADLRAEAERLQKTIDVINQQGMSSQGALGFNERKLEQVNDRIERLSAALREAQGAQDALTSKVSIFGPTLDGAKAAIDRFNAGASLGDILSGFGDAFQKRVKEMDDAQAAAQAGVAALVAQGASWSKAAAKEGKTATAQAQAAFAEIEANIRKYAPTAQAAAALIKQTREQLDDAFKGAASKDAADAAKKNAAAAEAAAKRIAAAYASAVKTIQDRIAADKEQLAGGVQTTAAEKERAKLLADIANGNLKVTAAQRANLLSLADQDVELQKNIALQKERLQGLADIQTRVEKLTAGLQDQVDQNSIDQISVQHGEEVTRRLQGELEIRQKYQREFDELNRRATRPENVGTANGVGGEYYNQQLAIITGFRDQSVKTYNEGLDALKRYQMDASNGVTSAIEDWMTTQQNAAAQAKTFTSDLIQGGSNAFAGWISGAQNAKSAFGDWIDTMRQKAAAFVADKLFQALIDAFSKTGTNNTTPGSTQGGWGSLVGNIANAFGFGGQRAAGGATYPGNFYRVNENGPELYEENGKTYLMAGGQQGNVVPLQQTTNNRSTNSVYNIYVAPTTTRRTASQIAQATDQRQRTAAARNG